MATVCADRGFRVVFLNHNQPASYCVPEELYEKTIDIKQITNETEEYIAKSMQKAKWRAVMYFSRAVGTLNTCGVRHADPLLISHILSGFKKLIQG